MRAARCPGCNELLDATHQPGCTAGQGAVTRAHLHAVRPSLPAQLSPLKDWFLGQLVRT